MDRELEGDPDLPRILRPRPAEGAFGAEGAEGRIEPGRVTYDEIRSEYLGMTPEEIEQRHRPPYEWTATPQEMERVVDWVDGRIAAQGAVKQDNIRKFLETYAAHRNIELNKLQAPTAARRGAFQREEETQFRWMQLGPDVLERAETGAAEPPLGGPSPRPSTSPPRPGLPGQVLPPPPPPPSLLDRPGGGVRPPPMTGQQQSRMNDRQRLARIPGWLERPEIVGVQGLSAEVYGHLESAHVDLKSNMPHYADVDDFNVLAGTDEIVVRNLFARLAATKAAVTDFYTSPVTTLDKNRDRLYADMAWLYNQLNKWRYVKTSDAFERRTDEELREEAESSLALPAAGVRVGPRRTRFRKRRRR